MVGSHWNRCFWTWPGGVRVCLLLTARCSCRGGCSLFEPRWKEESGCGGVFGGQGCSCASPLPFLGCIKCAAYCRAKIVEVVIHRDRSQEHRRWEANQGEVARLGVSGGLCFWPPLGGQAFWRMWVQEDALVLTQGSGRSLVVHWGSGSGPGLRPRDVLAGSSLLLPGTGYPRCS